MATCNDCHKQSKVKGYCFSHYRERTQLGLPLVKRPKGPRPKPKKPCLYCTNHSASRGMCNMHYTRFRTGYPLDAPAKNSYSELDKCPCGARPKSKGLCQRCYDMATATERRERMRRHYLENKAYYKAKKQRREYKQKISTPKWLSPVQVAEMNKIYRECPDGYEVDHIVPLNSESVSGLHVPWNLQYLTCEENRAKGNKLWQI